MDILINLAYIFFGLLGLFFGGNWLVDAASNIAHKLGVPALIVGLTVVAFGTSAPELMVSVRAALTGSSGIALGNVIGSNIANVGLILGVAGLIMPITVHITLVRREIPIMIGVTILAYLLMVGDQTISQLDGILLLIGFLTFNGVMLYATLSRSDEQKAADAATAGDSLPDDVSLPREWGILIVGIIVLVVGAELTVRGASTVAAALGVPEVVIGLTLVAFGTSLPELAASVIASMRGQSDIAVGNVIGSNIANLLLILGTTSVIRPIVVESPGTFSPYSMGVMTFDYPLMMIFALLMLPFALDRTLNRIESSFYLLTYVAFIVLSFLLK